MKNERIVSVLEDLHMLAKNHDFGSIADEIARARGVTLVELKEINAQQKSVRPTDSA